MRSTVARLALVGCIAFICIVFYGAVLGGLLL
jgi:hypothetical protein